MTAQHWCLRAGWVVPVAGPPIRDGAIAIAGEHILAVGPAAVIARASGGAPWVHRPAGIAIPGLVDAHTHLCWGGLAPAYAPFAEWIGGMAARVRTVPAAEGDVARTVEAAARRSLAGGVTAVGDSGPYPEAAAVIAQAGLRGRFYQELFGPDGAQAATAIAAAAAAADCASRALAVEPRGAAVALGLAPHAPYTVSVELLGRAAALAARHGWPVAVHLAESREERDFFRGQGPLVARLAARGVAVTPCAGAVAWLEAGQLLGRELVAVHLVQATPDELARLAAAGGCTAVVCPSANAFLGHGEPPIAAMLDAGLALALGTDSPASNPRGDLFEEMRRVTYLSRPGHPIDAARALEMATCVGASALGLAGRAGAIAPGMFADIAVVEPPAPLADPVETIVFTTVREHVALTVTSGVIRHSNRLRELPMVTAPTRRTIRVAHSPDADDAFMFHALSTGRIDTGALDFEHHLADIESLNQAAQRGLYEVSALSIHAYASVADRYWLMGCGASMGEGYGPVVVAATPLERADLVGRRIAIPGPLTTAYLATRLWLSDFEAVPVRYDRIVDAVRDGSVAAGVLIHERQLDYASHGLELVEDLGRWWRDATGLPLPLGGNVVRRDLGEPLARRITELVRESVRHALAHSDSALDHALVYASGLSRTDAGRFVGMYVNRRTIDYGPDGRAAVRELLDRARSAGLVGHAAVAEMLG